MPVFTNNQRLLLKLGLVVEKVEDLWANQLEVQIMCGAQRQHVIQNVWLEDNVFETAVAVSNWLKMFQMSKT